MSSKVSIIQATSGDPRRPENVCPYNPPTINPEERPPDVAMVMAAICGIAGVYMKMKVVLMACMFLMLSGVLTMRRDTMDSKQIVMTGTMALMGLLTMYALPPKPTTGGGATKS